MKTKNIRLIVSALVIVVIIIIVEFVLVSQRKTKAPITEVQGLRQTSANRSLAWIDHQRDIADDLYYLHGTCSDTKCTKLNRDTKSWREIAYVIWGRYKYFELTGDTSQLAKIDTDFKAIEKKPMQINSWNCKLMQEMIASAVLPLKEKDMAQNLCFGSGYEGNEEETTTDDAFINQVMIDIFNGKNVDTKDFDVAKLKTDFERNAFVAADYLAIYKTKAYPTLNFPDGKKILVEDLSRNNFLKALYGYSLLPKNKRTVYDNSILGVASLDLYNFTKIQGYLDFAIYLESLNTGVDTSTSLNDLAYHAFFLRDLSFIPGQEKFKNNFINDLNTIINSKFDGIGFNGNKWNKGAFFDPNNNFYSTQLNGLTVGVVSSL